MSFAVSMIEHCFAFHTPKCVWLACKPQLKGMKSQTTIKMFRFLDCKYCISHRIGVKSSLMFHVHPLNIHWDAAFVKDSIMHLLVGGALQIIH